MQSCCLSKESAVNAKHSNVVKRVNKYKRSNPNASAFHS